jgi:hypothetical protein
MGRKRSEGTWKCCRRGKVLGWIIAGSLIAARGTGAAAEEPSPALKVELVRPGEQVERVIALFKGTRVADPASALAAWNHARQKAPSLGKSTEALIAVFNPGMGRELRSLDDAQFRLLGTDPETGRYQWTAFLPRDQGRFASMTTALALTDGAVEESLGKVGVVRLGPVDSPLAATVDHRLILGSSRRALAEAVEEWATQRIPDDSRASGIYLRANASRLAGSSSLLVRRLSAMFGESETRACFRLDGDALSLDLSTPIQHFPGAFPAIDPTWLDPIPSERTIAAFAVALEPTPEMVSASFALLDRIEKADPARAEVAPLRTRLNLLSALAGVRPEVDLWPRLRGLSGFLLLEDEQRKINSALLILHLNDASSAQKLTTETIPKLLTAFAKPANGEAPARLTVQGEPFHAETFDRDVWIIWGDAARTAALTAMKDPTRSAAQELRAGWRGSRPQRFGAFWPGRFPRTTTSSPELDRVLAKAPPILWLGHQEEQTLRDHIQCGGLREFVQQALAVLPLDPPLDR